MSKPYQSILIPHYNLIRNLRYKRKTWKEISNHLATLGIKISDVGVYLFFKRAKNRIPLGLPQHGGTALIKDEIKKTKKKEADSFNKGFRTGGDIS